jgi:hypothetical protein
MIVSMVAIAYSMCELQMASVWPDITGILVSVDISVKDLNCRNMQNRRQIDCFSTTVVLL